MGKNAQPPVPSGDILPLLTLTLNGGATCNGTQTICTLPPGASISTNYYTHYNVEADDADPLPDRVVLTWQDTNSSGSNNPPVGDQEQFTGSTATITCAPCTEDQCQTCNETTNLCESANEGLSCDPDDPGSLCVPDSCVEGVCTADTGERTDCGPGGVCFNDICVDETGECATEPKNEGGVCDPEDPGSLCVPDSCVEGVCTADTGERDTCDGDECLACDDADGLCYPLPPETAPAECFGVEICRTPGFWGARGGFDSDGYYQKGQNVTGSVLCGGEEFVVDGECVEGHGLEVCGTLITNTDYDSGKSATEAICIKGGDPRAKMMRMLMSASLNCALGDCGANTLDLIDDCNLACEDNTDLEAINFCQSSLGCFNEGGHINADGTCSPAGQSFCENSQASCSDDFDCNVLDGESCVSYESCHDRMACPDYYDDGEVNGTDDCYEPLGAASSPQKCNAVRKNTPYIFDLPGWGTNP